MSTALRAGVLSALACLVAACPSQVLAGPSDYVFTPIVEEGEREIDFKAGTARLRDGTRANKESLGFGYGATSWWFTELYAVWHKEPGEPHGFDAWEWENKFQLTDTGRYPVDVGLVIEIERPKDRREGYEIKWGPLLQTELSPRLQANLNLLLEKHLRAEEGGTAELSYQWQLKYRWRPALEYGLQGFGELGPWHDWRPSSEQSHIAGPAVFGRVGVAERQAVRYNAAWLFGLGHGAPRNTLRVQAEYEF